VVKTLWHDSVFAIDYATLGPEQEPEHNRVWYHVHGSGYVHSGEIQPVRTVLNEVQTNLPEVGSLAEVSVPYTDAYWRPDPGYRHAYRLYYETTHWITALVTGEDGEPWYAIQEDKWDLRYYAPARHIRIIPEADLQPLSADVPAQFKKLVVDTENQLVIAYEYGRAIFMTRTATGAKFSNGDYSTPAGTYITAHKRPSRHMAAGNLAYNGYDLPGVPWVSYITESGISFHGTYWHNNYGRPRSHGCINLTPHAARFVYLWTQPVVPPHEQRVIEDYGTQVEVI
jgi:lipoprotein-anchoring transpeptidase ErfK/SrfK